MTNEKDQTVRLNHTPFSGRWEVVRLAADGRTIAQRWPLHPDDAALLDAALLDAANPPGGESRD